MPLAGVWFRAWIYLGLICGWTGGSRPRFDTSTDMGLVLIPADAEIDSVVFRLRATDQDADFPLIFEITATITPVVRIDNLPCTLYNKVCQANVILTKRLMPGRLHDFAVRVRDTKGDSNSMQATISATNATTSRDKIFPHIPSLIMVPEDTKPGKELDYLLVRANAWSGKPVYIELWQPKELFTIRQRQTPTQTRGIITLIGELDFEMQSMYTLTIYATDPYTEPGKDTRNIAGLNIVVIVQDVQDVPPIFTLAPPLTRLNNSVQTGDIILRVHAEDGDKGVPRDIIYGLVSEGNPFVPFFNISETTGEIALARPLEELTQITHVGAPVVLSVVAEEIRRSRDEPPAQATVVEVGFLLGEPGNSPPYFENDNYVTSIPENLELGSAIKFPEQYSTKVRDEDIGKAGVFALKLQNNNGTFEVNPTVAERTANFLITVRDNTLIDYEMHKSLVFRIIAQEVGPATNLSASAAVVIYIKDVNDNSPIFDEKSYEVTLSENVTAATRVIQVRATDKDTGLFSSIKYTGITGQGSNAFAIDPDTGLITVAMGSSLDREMAAQLQLTVHARDENGRGNTGVVPLIVNLLDVNDNAPIFEKDVYEFTLNSDLTNFTTPTIIKATDADAESPNNDIRYELIHGNYENKFYLNEITGELILRSPITKFRRKKQSGYENLSKKLHKGFLQPEHTIRETVPGTIVFPVMANTTKNLSNDTELKRQFGEIKRHRRKRAETDILYTLTARAYDLGVPHLASETQILIIRGGAMEARIMMFVVPGEHPNLSKTAETLATITGGRVTVLDTRPYLPDNRSGIASGTVPAGGERTIVVARVEQTKPGAPLVDVEKIRNTLAANGVGIIGGAGSTNVSMTYSYETTTKLPIDGIIRDGGNGAGAYANKTISSVHEEVTVYKAENKLLFWLLIILGLLMLLAIAALIICCICPGCPFYMAPRKRRVYSSETLIARSDGRPKRHLHRKPMTVVDITSNGKKQAWSADPTRRNWQFNRRNTKNGGLASLPGDVVYISERPTIDQANVESFRVRDGLAYDPSRRRRMEEQERMYVEDVEERKARDYDATDADSLQRHEIERGSDILRQTYRQRYADPESNNEPAIREQHFYREGNAEVLQLVTRGQVEDDGSSQHHRYPMTFIVDGKDVLLQRFMQDQKARHELSVQEPEVMGTVESHQRQKKMYQQEVILLPENLEIRHGHADELKSSAQKLAMDDRYETHKMDAESPIRDVRRQEVSTSVVGMSFAEQPSIPKDQMRSTTVQSYPFHDLELARQNALLTRLLLERESRYVGGAIIDATNYLETQSLPGQVAIATQTEKATATQTERHVRSRSDNDESDEDSRNRRRMKTVKRHGDSESRRTRALWMKSPIEEEEGSRFDKRLNILRKKVKEAKEGRKVSLEPEVLREISHSLDENGSFYRGRDGRPVKTDEKSTEDSSIGYKVLGEEKNGSSSSTEMSKQQHERTSDERKTEISSSPEISVDNGKYIRETTEKKCSRKESKVKKQKRVESVIKPSFRVLEREITMLTKKLSKLADKKVKQTTGEESTSKDRSRASKKSKKDADQGVPRKTESSKEEHKRPEATPDTSKETMIAKTRQKFKYQQPQVMSPGSSEYDDAFEKPKKSKSSLRQEIAKYKHMSSRGHTKAKKQTQMQIERKEQVKKQVARQDREIEKRKEAADKESGRSEAKTEKTAKLSSRAQKLAAIGRRENVLEETSTSTSSDRTNGKKDPFIVGRDSDKKSTSSEIPSNHADQRESRRKLDHASEGFSDDFVTEPQKGDIDQRDVFRSTMDTSVTETHKQDETIQQFSDDFAIETRTEKMEHQTSITVESSSEIRHSVFDFDKERMTLQKVSEDVDFRDLDYTRFKIEPDTEREQQAVSLEPSHVEQFDNRGETMIPVDSVALKVLEERQVERPSSRSSTVTIVETHTREKPEEGTDDFSHEIEKEISRMKETTLEKDVELKSLGDTERIAREETNALVKHAEISSDTTERAKQEERKENGDAEISLSKMEEDSKPIEDITESLRSVEEDKAVELRKDGSDLKEKLSHDSKEEQISLEKSTIDTDMEDEIKITAADTNGHEDISAKPEDISKEYIIQVSDAEEIKKDVKSTTEALEETSEITQTAKDDAETLIDIHRMSLIDGSDETLIDVEAVSQEIPKDNLIHLSKATDTPKEDIDTDKLDRLDDLATKIEIESHETKEESHISPQQLSPLRETKLVEADEPLASLTEVTTAKQEVTDKEQLQVTKVEKSFPLKHEEGREESFEMKEGDSKEIEEALDKDSTSDHVSKDLDREKSDIGKTDTVDKSESADAVDSQDHDRGEQQADVSVPIFSSFIDTLEVSEESDSSSDISRKTTLTARTYDTPRHRQKWQQQESLEIAGMPAMKASEDRRGAKVEIESEEDAESNLSPDEIENAEDSIAIVAIISDPKEDTESATTSEKISSDDEKVLSMSSLKRIADEDRQGKDFETKLEEALETEKDMKDIRDLLTIPFEIPLLLSFKELSGTSKKDESIQVTKEDVERTSRSAHYGELKKVSETIKQDGKSEIRSPSKKVVQVGAKGTRRRTQDAEVEKTKTVGTEVDKIKRKEVTPSISEKHVARIESFESSVKKKRKPERWKASSPRERKRAPDEGSVEGTPLTRSRHRSRTYINGDTDRQTKGDGSQKQTGREEEHQRKQTLPRPKLKMDKKSMISTRGGEIDASKTRSKYMAWYNKKREEAEKRKLEKKTVADEGQLPRWVNRGLKRHPIKSRVRQGMEHKTLEMTPRTKRKVKPLVNVESEQLKAIVRQGRQLRKAEGNLREDPPIQIFARTPPVSTETQHRLVQHSEYKYEKIPPPFYLHPPPAPHPSPQLSPERSLEMQPCTSQYEQSQEKLHSDNVVPLQSGTRLRHQQLLEKKSVFDIAYSEAAPSQLRSDSTTPPS